MTGYRDGVAAAMTEAELQRNVVDAARMLGWHPWHSTIAYRSASGWPDLVLVHPGQGRILFRELKTQKGKVTAAQEQWLAVLAAAGGDAGVWRPADWMSGAITRELIGKDATETDTVERCGAAHPTASLACVLHEGHLVDHRAGPVSWAGAW